MEMRPALVHIALATAIGGLICAFTPARWLAASLWVSAAMLVTGAVATVEDMSPGGFDNPAGSNTRKGAGVTALKCVAAAFALVGLGFAVQFVWLSPP
jgi:hypothetical protein